MRWQFVTMRYAIHCNKENHCNHIGVVQDSKWLRIRGDDSECMMHAHWVHWGVAPCRAGGAGPPAQAAYPGQAGQGAVQHRWYICAALRPVVTLLLFQHPRAPHGCTASETSGSRGTRPGRLCQVLFHQTRQRAEGIRHPRPAAGLCRGDPLERGAWALPISF